MQKLINYSKIFCRNTILEHKTAFNMLFNILNKLNNLKQSLQLYNTIYIDVSVYSKSDSKTGIQRVIREVIYQILLDEIILPKIKFVIATQKIGYRTVDYHVADDMPIFDISSAKNFIHPNRHDIFLGLDFCPNIIPYHLTTFIQWKLKGVAFEWILYDLLPVTNPEWFTTSIQNNFIPWLKTIFLLADKVLCISHTVEKEARVFSKTLEIQPSLATIKLGQGFNVKTANYEKLKTSILTTSYLCDKYILMVGTLEPRKGHLPVIQAFTKLWLSSSTDYSLILVGRQGWLVENLIKDIEASQFYNKKLIWLNDVEDTSLGDLYEKSKGVIVASFNEGYGLPLIEGLSFNKPVLARDIPVFNEIAKNHPSVTFFKSNKIDIEYELKNWLSNLTIALHQPSLSYSSWQTTWEDIKASFIKRS